LSATIAELSKAFPIWFCDIWGVIHDGDRPVAPTVAGLIRHRKRGGIVILVSNSPRTAAGVERQLDEIGVDRYARDAVVTSGDVTRQLIVDHGGGKVFHLGPARDLSIFHGLDVRRVELESAHAVLCTGLFHEAAETPGDYRALLAEMKAKGLAMICANPDKMVKKGTRLIYCAGALADAYAAIGGKVLMAGKPFAPIYDLALRKAEALARRPITRHEILAIGDGPETDIRGAAAYGLAAVLVADGVTGAAGGLEAAEAQVRAMVAEADIRATVHDLMWIEKDG